LPELSLSFYFVWEIAMKTRMKGCSNKVNEKKVPKTALVEPKPDADSSTPLKVDSETVNILLIDRIDTGG
jgi:hypothetical protein